MQLYRMHDAPDASKAAVPVSREEANAWNTPERGMGIFWTVNTFENAVRRKEHLVRINAWAIDMDEGTKDEMAAKLRRSPLVPTAIVETKRGYQAYWAAKDGQAAHWNALVLERLVPHFGSDKNARDLCRILRAPGFLHLKDPANPFKCRTVWKHEVAYTERQLADAFAWSPNLAEHKRAHEAAKRAEQAKAPRPSSPDAGMSESLWEAIYRLNARDTLERLSGHWAVGGESYSFRQNSNGKANLFVGGKGTSCFVDENGHIGSLSGGGPTPAQWLKWYGHDWKRVIEILKEVHPHLADIDEANRKARRSA
jgi:hypothetical protein